MRELKFRIWDYCASSFMEEGRGQSIWDCCYDGEVCYQQYTGLKDVNGVEIYEGDILKLLDGSTYEVKFYVEDNELDCSGYMFSSFGVEIIGNLYENPELLEQ